ncbi:MAG: pirin family protein [Bacteroidales bacterium]|nr:pirin family protein [Bacteroidales bacterium]
MKINIHKANRRGTADYQWLKANYSFSFANYFDPLRERFGVLRVLNDDTIEGGGGFGMHPHNNMEIVTIPLSGSLEHRDSMGHTSVITAGEIQYMSAGSGVMHSEYNASDTVQLNLLQIWIFPKVRNTAPAYNQISLAGKQAENTILTVVSPDGGDNIIAIRQDAWFSLLKSEAGKSYQYEVNKAGNLIFVFVIEGSVSLGDVTGERRDSIEVSDAGGITFSTLEKSEILIIEVPED